MKAFILTALLFYFSSFINAQNIHPKKFPVVQNHSIVRFPSDESFIQPAWCQPIETPGSVGKYQKAEFGFKLSDKINNDVQKFLKNGDTTGLNPYDPEHINFEVTFIAPSGIQTKRFGFYYQPFLEDHTYNKWEHDSTSFSWRVRFAPDELGEWKVKIQVFNKNSVSPVQLDLMFTTVVSKHKGVLVASKTGTERDRYLSYSETGETFVARGNNVSSGGFLTYTPSQNRDHLKGVQQLIDAGGNFTRLDMQPQAALPDWPVYNNYNGKLDEMYAFDKMVELCEKNGVYFIVFRHHVELQDGSNSDGTDWSNVSWYQNPYKIGLALSGRKEYLTNEEALEWQSKSLRYVFSRWGYSANFSFYGYSEINYWVSGIVKEAIVQNPKYNDEAAVLELKDWFINQKKYILKELNNKMLFSNSYASTPSFEFNPLYDGFMKNSDIVSYHLYECLKGNNYDYKAKIVDYNWDHFHKPVLFEEMGIDPNKLVIYCCTGIEYHNSIWATSLMGSCGTGLDWWWNRGVQDFGYQKQLRHITTFFIAEDLKKMNYKPQRWSDQETEKARKIENYSLVSEDKQRVLGWVHNATYFWRNLYFEYPCIKELVDKNSLDHSCFVGEGYDLNNSKDGNYNHKRYEDDYTLSTGAIPINNGLKIEKNPTFKIVDLLSSFGFKKNYYKIEFYSTTGKDLVLDASFTQIVSSNISGNITPYVPNLDKVNPDYAYKVTYLGKLRHKPTI